MKKIIYLLVVLLCVNTSCSPTKWFFNFSSSLENYSIDEQEVTLAESNGDVFSNESVELFLKLSNRGYNIRIKNKTKKPMIIDWDRISYIGINGSANRIIHRGVKFINKSNTQEKTIIPPGATISDEIIPANNIQYKQALPGTWGLMSGQTYTGWSIGNILPYYTKDVEERNSWTKYYIGKSVSLYLPVEIDSITTYYKFNFVIDKINITQHNPDIKYEVKGVEDFLMHNKK